jgi:serine/threonine protein kinase
MEPVLIGFGLSELRRARTTLNMRLGQGESPFFCAPEVLNHGQFGSEADIFALGMIMYCLLGGRLPSDSREVRRQIGNGMVPMVDGPKFQLYKDIMMNCWLTDKARRLSAGDLLNRLRDARFAEFVKPLKFVTYVRQFGDERPAGWHSNNAKDEFS